MRNFVRTIVQERKAALLQNEDGCKDEPPSPTSVRKTRHALLDLLLRFHMQGQLTEEEVMEEVNTFVFAGHDTVGISIAFTLFCLGHHPEVQERVAREIEHVMSETGEYEVTADQVKKLKYLEAVIKESLRLFPPGPSFGRKIKEDVSLNGYHVPAGTDVWLNVKAIHMDPAIFPDPQKFDPERFMNESSIPAFAFAAFSLGPRNCIGSRFAMIEEKILLAHVLRKFQIVSHVPAEDLILNFEIILRCRTPMTMEFIPKSSSPVPGPKNLSPLALHVLSRGS
jgi:cytochrome P450